LSTVKFDLRNRNKDRLHGQISIFISVKNLEYETCDESQLHRALYTTLRDPKSVSKYGRRFKKRPLEAVW